MRWLPPSPARVLDAGCGPGHHCGRLADEGFEAVGLDLDEAMIDAARTAYPAASFHVRDLRGIDRIPGRFDGAFCLGNVAAHLPPEDLVGVLEILHDRMPPGAPWLVQTVNWDALIDRGGHRFPDRDLGGAVFRREYVDITSRSATFRTSLWEGERRIFAGDEILYPLTSVAGRELHEAAGFELVEHCADFVGAPFAADRPGGSVMAYRRR